MSGESKCGLRQLTSWRRLWQSELVWFKVSLWIWASWLVLGAFSSAARCFSNQGVHWDRARSTTIPCTCVGKCWMSLRRRCCRRERSPWPESWRWTFKENCHGPRSRPWEMCAGRRRERGPAADAGFLCRGGEKETARRAASDAPPTKRTSNITTEMQVWAFSLPHDQANADSASLDRMRADHWCECGLHPTHLRMLLLAIGATASPSQVLLTCVLVRSHHLRNHNDGIDHSSRCRSFKDVLSTLSCRQVRVVRDHCDRSRLQGRGQQYDPRGAVFCPSRCYAWFECLLTYVEVWELGLLQGARCSGLLPVLRIGLWHLFILCRVACAGVRCQDSEKKLLLLRPFARDILTWWCSGTFFHSSGPGQLCRRWERWSTSSLSHRALITHWTSCALCPAVWRFMTTHSLDYVSSSVLGWEVRIFKNSCGRACRRFHPVPCLGFVLLVGQWLIKLYRRPNLGHVRVSIWSALTALVFSSEWQSSSLDCNL